MLEVNEGLFRPQGNAQLFARNNLCLSLQQQAQHLERLLLNTQRSTAGFPQFTTAQIDLELAKTSAFRGCAGGGHLEPHCEAGIVPVPQLTFCSPSFYLLCIVQPRKQCDVAATGVRFPDPRASISNPTLRGLNEKQVDVSQFDRCWFNRNTMRTGLRPICRGAAGRRKIRPRKLLEPHALWRLWRPNRRYDSWPGSPTCVR